MEWILHYIINSLLSLINLFAINAAICFTSGLSG